MPNLKPWPVLVGALVDLLGTLVVMLFYLSIVLGAQFSGGEATEDVLTPMQLAVGDGPGLLLSVVGGFVAGRLAKIDEVHHGAAAGFSSLVASLLIGWGSPVQGALSWRDVLLPLAVVPAAALGGYIAARLNARTPRHAAP
jgi:hypothetical protein